LDRIIALQKDGDALAVEGDFDEPQDISQKILAVTHGQTFEINV